VIFAPSKQPPVRGPGRDTRMRRRAPCTSVLVAVLCVAGGMLGALRFDGEMTGVGTHVTSPSLGSRVHRPGPAYADSLGIPPRSVTGSRTPVTVTGFPDESPLVGERCARIVSWLQSGIQGTEVWWVNILGAFNLTGTGANSGLGGEFLSGTYNWTAGTGVANGRVFPDAGSFVSDCNAPGTFYLNFSVPNATVTFEETGLNPSGDWWVNISGPVFPDGHWVAATSPLVLTTLDSGSYNYSIEPPGEGGVTAVPRAGTLSVGTNPISISLRFLARVYEVTFSPRFEGTSPVPWSAEVFGVYYINGSNGITPGSDLFANGTTSAPPVGLANGTYDYNVTVPSGYSASPSGGSVQVNGTGFSVNVTISPVRSSGLTGAGLVESLAIGISLVVVALVVTGVVLHRRRKRQSPPPS